MSHPTDEEVYQYIQEIVKGVDNIEKRLAKDVKDMCNLLSLLLDDCKKRVSNNGDIPQELKQSFKDIYGSLKLHVKFHLYELEVSELKNLGEKIGLTDEELGDLPDIPGVIDPGSKVLEILSDVIEFSNGPKGSEDHADTVMTVAKSLFSVGLAQKQNIFKPKVLARVSRNDKWFVGSSVAVSHFLRPLYLYNRIYGFKKSLKEAVVYFQPLENEDEADWNSLAFGFGDNYETEKFACKNCKIMFNNLSGFLRGTDDTESFLAACGEYPPTNQCLPDDAEADNEAVIGALTKFRDKCESYFQRYPDGVYECFSAYESKENKLRKAEILRKVYNTYVKDTMHIFGIKPDCNGSLRP